MTTFLGLPRRAAAPESPLRGALPFPKAARAAVADPQLRHNLGKATATIRAKRAAVVAEVPDWEELRRSASAIKADVMARLPELLETLERNVIARGGQVHWAPDAEAANRIVAELAARALPPGGPREVVKVKSMATQEIGLNEYLAEQGIDAIETDLAELIVQLGHDKPSHILVPAIHRNRSEIKQIFEREMPDAPSDLTDEPRRLAMAARAHLRRKFLSAQVAISGANFAVADTGTLVVLESEGNGRMCLTLPRTLITVMGIEKLVPTFSDLEVFLQLLPRSSTGERMNPYTSLWTGVTPGDGPQEFHLVLLDNGRTNALADPDGREALHCIRCSACLNVCPVYETGRRPRLRIGLPGADRRRADAAAHRHHRRSRRERDAALCVDALRCLLRRLPGADRHPDDAGAPAGQGGRRAPRDARRLGHGDEHGELGDEQRAPIRPGGAGEGDGAGGLRAEGTDRVAALAVVGLDHQPGPSGAAEAVVPPVVGGESANRADR